MITVAIANVLESSQQALAFIYEASKLKGLKVQSISPEQNIVYAQHKRLPLKQYLDVLDSENKYDLLIVELSKEAIRKQIYESLDFNIAVFFGDKGFEKKGKTKRGCMTQHLMNTMRSNYYVLPEAYRNSMPRSVTYGWSREAHVSATSAYTTLDGQMAMQCCVGESIPTLYGDIIQHQEFSIQSQLDSIEGVLAGVATLMIYGLNLE